MTGLQGTDLQIPRSNNPRWETTGKPAPRQACPWNLSHRSCSAFMMARSIATVTLL